MTSFEKSIDIDLMEFNRNMALMEDADYIAFIEGDYYEESGESKKPNIFEKAIKYVRDLIKKIKDKISEKFSEANVKKQQKKLEMEILSDPNKKNKKVKVRVNDKVYALDKKALGDLKKCKTKDQVEKYMKDYKKKREKLVAGSIVAVSAATAIGILGSKLHKTHKQLDELQGEYERSIKTIADNAKEISKLNNELEMAYDFGADAETYIDIKNDRIRDLTDRNKALIKIARNDRNKNTKYLNYIVKQARNTKADTVNSNAKNYYYNYAIGTDMFNGDMDRANKQSDIDVQRSIILNMNSIISAAVKLGADVKPAID